MEECLRQILLIKRKRNLVFWIKIRLWVLILVSYNFVTIMQLLEGNSIIFVDGKYLKNQIAFKCKKTAYYQSILKQKWIKQHPTDLKISTINLRILQTNFLDKSVCFIIDTCKELDIGTIVLGYNSNFQFKSNMDVKQN